MGRHRPNGYLVVVGRISVGKRAEAFEEMALAKMRRAAHAAGSCIASVALAVSLVPAPAFADDVSDAQSALDAAEARMRDVSAEYDKLAAELSTIQQQIDATADEAMRAQQAVISGRDALSASARSEYRSPSVESLLTLVLEARSFDELARNVVYANSILQAQADEVAAQKQRVATLDGITQELNGQKSIQQRALRELDETKQQAEAIVSQAAAHLQNAQDAEAARLEALRVQANDMNAAPASTEQVSDAANTTTREEVVPDTAPVAPNPDPDPPSSDDSQTSADWKTGIASAYGGSTDPYTPNPGTTATGDVCDDNSMGVAIPTSWPNYRSYLGRTVQISYNGRTVYAVINDCGSMGGGSRALDLQPGVWKAFGFSSCTDWGLRTVSYRIL